MSGLTGTVTAVRTFTDEVIAELKKSSWPTWPELVGSTAVIIFTVVLLGFFVGASDLGLEWLIKLLVTSR